MAANAEALDLRRRARRRLTGAIALVLALVIVPPWVMDLEPRPVTSDLTVQIPSQEGKRLKAPAPPAKTSEPAEIAKAEPNPAAQQPTPEPPKPATAKPAAKAEAVARAAPAEAVKKETETKRAEAILGADAFVVPLGAFANRENVKSLEGKLVKAGVKHYTETVAIAGGEQTRVRAGPYSSKEAAEKVREELLSLGLAPGRVIPKQ
jgi:DedD protein